MDKIEEVKRILVEIDELARKIQQLFELENGVKQIRPSRLEPKSIPDFIGDKEAVTQSYGRLLTEEERTLAYKKHLGMPEEHGLCFCIAQDAKTASIKDAECQARIEELKRGIEEHPLDIEGYKGFLLSREELQALWRAVCADIIKRKDAYWQKVIETIV